MLPQSLVPDLREQLALARLVWAGDAQAGTGGVELSHALELTYPRMGAS